MARRWTSVRIRSELSGSSVIFSLFRIARSSSAFRAVSISLFQRFRQHGAHLITPEHRHKRRAYSELLQNTIGIRVCRANIHASASCFTTQIRIGLPKKPRDFEHFTIV